MRDYCVGLMACRDSKSAEPMPAVTLRERTVAQHQSLLHFVCSGAPHPERAYDSLFRRTARIGDGSAEDHRDRRQW
ncbi:hypothetical protein P0R27_37665 [Bradyrhizobium yuanmingense]|nr:hypothetical protein [Bradyrhizobium yuanmingense]MDF0498992.1 hypothetical protein [Bradyrhizobium yuanmingense]